jgi:hypothetical protein
LEPGPVVREPRPPQGIISFPGIDGWLLRAPAQHLQSTGQVVGRGAHPEGHQPHRTDAQEGPPIRLKTGLESAVLEDCQHALPLLGVQAGRSARNGTCVQAGQVALMLAELLSPFTDGHPTDALSAGDVGVGQLTSLEQPASFQAAFFTLRAGEVFWAPDHGRLL